MPKAGEPGWEDQPEFGRTDFFGPPVDIGKALQDTARAALVVAAMSKYIVEFEQTLGVVLLSVNAGFWERTRSDAVLLKTILRGPDINAERQRFEVFKESWKMGRMLVPLRGRLLMEQVLWDMGWPWKTLVTGFQAIGEREEREALRFGKEEEKIAKRLSTTTSSRSFPGRSSEAP